MVKKFLFVFFLFFLIFLSGCVEIQNFFGNNQQDNNYVSLPQDDVPADDSANDNFNSVVIEGCGNSVCSGIENVLNCPQDCFAKLQKTSKCNFNNLCEGFESQDCGDCQC
ncbi:MAG: hypothetical protein Q7K42_04930, partial [Candidatus Diapherotrites archaeon]|nr:hypothetical protein [Candidatus Diapherotrites archaeon]